MNRVHNAQCEKGADIINVSRVAHIETAELWNG